MRLAGKRALITGSSRGIGAAIAVAFANEGASVVVNYNHVREDAQRIVDSIRGSGGMAILVRADVADPSSVKDMFSTISEQLGGLDILVNNAGLADGAIWNAEFSKIKVEMWNKVLAVDLMGTFLCTQAAIPLLKTHGGKVLNISSTPVLTGDTEGIVYAAVKGSVLALTKMLARSLAPEITVNCLLLGAIQTTWLNWLSPARAEELRKNIPLGRFGIPEEVAKVALFFASDDSRYVTGQSLVVDGGEVMD